MAQVTVTAAQIAVLYPDRAEIYDRIAAVALTAGELVYLDTAGKAAKTVGTGAATMINTGLVLNSAGAGAGVSVLKRGYVAGVNVSGLAFGAPVYVSDTAGQIADAAGSVSKVLGTVGAVAQANGPQKVLYVDQTWA